MTSVSQMEQAGFLGSLLEGKVGLPDQVAADCGSKVCFYMCSARLSVYPASQQILEHSRESALWSSRKGVLETVLGALRALSCFTLYSDLGGNLTPREEKYHYQ